LSYAGLIGLSIADLAGFEDISRRQANISWRRNLFLIRNKVCPLALLRHFAAILRSVIFLSKPHLGAGFDDQRIGLGAIDLSENAVRIRYFMAFSDLRESLN
jgi:hypothetical protein